MPSISGWIRPSSTFQFVVIRSRVYELPLHFVGSIGHARCIRAGCELCAALGAPKEHHAVVVSKPKAAGFWLLELTNAHEELADALKQMHGEEIGRELRIGRRASSQDPVQIELSDQTFPCSIVSVPHYVAAIGMKQRREALMRLELLAARDPSQVII